MEELKELVALGHNYLIENIRHWSLTITYYYYYSAPVPVYVFF